MHMKMIADPLGLRGMVLRAFNSPIETVRGMTRCEDLVRSNNYFTYVRT